MYTYEQVEKNMDKALQTLKPYAEEETFFELTQLQKHFKEKVEDIQQEGRKLNIGVIGRVKAGKSSFLNTLLFDGQEVLPKAATPKTATLTKMEYAPENRIVITFYTQEEWHNILEDSKYGDSNEISKSAKELVDMAERNHLDVEELLKQKTYDRTFESYEELVDFLNEYVGENGTYTPVVRSVVIYMNREEFQEISIVDTPGLNDPVPSRTQKTKEFIEVCDVVFFLSRAGSFLDVNDWELLCKQLPQKGVKEMILVASQYDSGIRDVLKKPEKLDFFAQNNSQASWRKTEDSDSKATNIEDAERIVKSKLQKRIREKIETYKKEQGAYHKEVIRVLETSKEPIMLSARAQDMSRKSYEEYNEEERQDLTYWKDFIPEDQRKEVFARIGNFEVVQEKYRSLKEKKQEVLESKKQNMIPTFCGEVSDYLAGLEKDVTLRQDCIRKNDKESLNEQKRAFEQKQNGIHADVLEVFGDTMDQVKAEKLEINKQLRAMSTEAATLKTKTGTEVHHGSHTSYRFNLGPIHLGGHTESYSYTTTYKYLAASDALEQINAYGKNAASAIEGEFGKIVNKKEYRRRLLNAVINNFDTSDENFDVNYFRVIVQKAINQIEFPEVHIDVSRELQLVGDRFSGEVRHSSEQDEFRRLLSNTVEEMYQGIQNKVDTTISEFQKAARQIQDHLCDDILKSIAKEFEEVRKALESKEQELKKCEDYLACIAKIRKDFRKA